MIVTSFQGILFRNKQETTGKFACRDRKCPEITSIKKYLVPNHSFTLTKAAGRLLKIQLSCKYLKGGYDKSFYHKN